MASFCTKCGASLNPGTAFCTACGAPAPAAAIPPTTPYMPSQQPVQSGPQPGGSSAVKIILIVVGVFVGLGILGAAIFAFTIWRVAHAVHVNNHDGTVSVHTPGGTFSSNSSTTYSATDLGVDLYPGATASAGGSKIDTPGGAMTTAAYLTPDSKDQVVSFYKSKLGGGASVFDTAHGAFMTLTRSNKETVMVTINSDPARHEGKTQITIMHSTNTK